ncbi:uncharacterized protein METZ01_LOCUS241642, partial [marine metagenome]
VPIILNPVKPGKLQREAEGNEYHTVQHYSLKEVKLKENPDQCLDFLFLFHFNPTLFRFNLGYGINTWNFRNSGHCWKES